MEIVFEKLHIGNLLDIFTQLITAPTQFFRCFFRFLFQSFRCCSIFFSDFVCRRLKLVFFQQNLLRRIDFHEFQVFHGSLGIQAEGTDGVNLCAEKFNSVRVLTIRRKDINDTAADAVFPTCFHHTHTFISHLHQALLYSLYIQFFTQFDFYGLFFKSLMRCYFFDGSRNRSNHDNRLAGTQCLQCFQPVHHHVMISGLIFQKDMLLCRQHINLSVPYKKREVFRQSLRPCFTWYDDNALTFFSG